MTSRMVTDQMHRTVLVPEHPQRIISLVPSQTELLYDLGLGERVVVSRGVLAGLEGLVIQVDDSDTIMLKPDGVVAGVLLRLPPGHIEPLHS